MWPAAAALSLLLAASNPAVPNLLRWFLIIAVCLCGAQAVVDVSRRGKSS